INALNEERNILNEFKKQLGMGIVSAALGILLIAGGTFVYFSNTETTGNTFAAGTLDLSAELTTIINVESLKTGDSMVREFELQNNGSLYIVKVHLETDYSVIDAKDDNTDDFGKHIEVEFFYNANNLDEVIDETTMHKL